MPEQPELPKISQSASPPVARSGAGDISERELVRERGYLQTTPPANRVQPAHPKKQLFSVPVSKFTAKGSPGGGGHLVRLRSCLDEFQNQTPKRVPVKIGPKAVSMEDLTPTKRIRKDKKDEECTQPRAPRLRELGDEEAAARVARFMLVACWRRRRHEVKCLRKTLEAQLGCSERLRMQVSALKALLDSDNSKVRLAMRELDRLKQLLRDKELERTVLEREKIALEKDVCAAEDRASEMSMGWRNCRNELEGTRAAAAVTEHALSLERAAAAEARLQRDQAFTRLKALEEDLATAEDLAAAAEEEARAQQLRADDTAAALQRALRQLAHEREAREQCAAECAELKSAVESAARETSALKAIVLQLQTEISRLDLDLKLTRQQLDWWPRPLTRMLGKARTWLRYPGSLPDAVLWTLVPARHGC